MINNILKLPIVKLIAMIALLYYIFDKTKNDPRSVASKINKENISRSVEIIKQNIHNASQVTQNLNQDQKDAYTNEENTNNEQKTELTYQDIRKGLADNEAVCGSEVEIEYTLMNKNNNDIINKSNIKFDIGSKFNEIIEKSLIGMSPGGVRVVDIPKSFKTGDELYDNMIQNSNMAYKILLLKVSDNPKANAICYE